MVSNAVLAFIRSRQPVNGSSGGITIPAAPLRGRGEHAFEPDQLLQRVLSPEMAPAAGEFFGEGLPFGRVQPPLVVKGVLQRLRLQQEPVDGPLRQGVELGGAGQPGGQRPQLGYTREPARGLMCARTAASSRYGGISSRCSR